MATPSNPVPHWVSFPDHWSQFFRDFAHAQSYWYVPKARTLDDGNVEQAAQMLNVLSRYETARWNVETQRRLLSTLRHEGIVNPSVDHQSPQDESALARILKQFLGQLGLLWLDPSQGSIVITEAGSRLRQAYDKGNDLAPIIETQLIKLQYPNPLQDDRNKRGFQGLLPYVFLLQVLERSNWWLSDDEFYLFINLATSHSDLEPIVTYIDLWRQLAPEERDAVKQPLETLAWPDRPNLVRLTTIRNDGPYQKAQFSYPRALEEVNEDSFSGIRCVAPEVIRDVLEQLGDFAIPTFTSPLEWISYYGDPEQQPDWFTVLMLHIQRADTLTEAESVVASARDRVDEEEHRALIRRQREKVIEDWLEQAPDQLEPGLHLEPDGRQYQTATGAIDLLCRDQHGTYVVVEIKVDEAEDSVFGQILRYIGWVHTSVDGGRDNVRGIVVAGSFPTKAKYARLGLMRPDAADFIRFFEHGLAMTEA